MSPNTKQHNSSQSEDSTGTYTFPKTRIVAAINVSYEASKDQLKALFGFCGRVKDIALYPPIHFMPFAERGLPYRVCVVKYAKSSYCGVALHLTGTVFLDKTLMVVPCSLEEIPDDEQIVWDAVCAGVKTLMARPRITPTPSEQSETASVCESDKENGLATAPKVDSEERKEDKVNNDGSGRQTSPIPAETTQIGSCEAEAGNEDMILDVEVVVEGGERGSLKNTGCVVMTDVDENVIHKDQEEEQSSMTDLI